VLARGYHRRDTLLAMFWPEVNEERGRNSLRQAAHHLRRALGAGVIVGRGDEELAVDDTKLWCDAPALERALDTGDLAAALELYRGDLLPGLFVPDAPGFERWLDNERTRLKGRTAEAGWTLAEREAAQGNAAAAGHWARWAAALAPDDEVALRRLMTFLARIGDRTGAVRAHASFAQRLSDEYDARPSAETEALLAEIRGGAGPAPVAPPRAAPAPAFPTPMHVAAASAHLAPSPPTAPPAPVTPRIAAPRPWRSRALLLGSVALVIILAATGVWRRQAESAIPVDDNALVTFPFVVRGDPALAYLRDGMVDLLDARLDGAGGLRTIDPHAIQAAVARESGAATLDPGLGSTLSRQLGARLFILGEIVAAHGHVQLGATLYDGAHGAPLAHATVDGDAVQLFQLVDGLAAQLLVNRPEGPDTRLTRVAALTTRSIDALRAYVDGERAYRAGRYQEAVDAFERATALDTSFALAWYRLAIARDWTGSGAAEPIAHALAHVDALAPRERMLVGGFWQYIHRDPSTERVYHVAVTQHPDDVEAWSFLGETLFHMISSEGRSFVEARVPFERVLALDPGDPNALIHLLRIAASEGRSAEVDSLARVYLAGHADADRALEVRVLRAFALHDRAAEDRLVAELGRAADVMLDVAARGVAAFVQDLGGAERIAPLFLTPERTGVYPARGHVLAAEVALAAGRWDLAQRRLAALGAMEPDWALELRALFAAQPMTPATPAELAALRDDLLQWRVHPTAVLGNSNFAFHRQSQPLVRDYLLGLISVRLDDTAAARGYATELDRLGANPADSGLARDYAHSVRTEIALRAGALRRALAEVEQVHFTAAAPVMSVMLHAGAHERFLHAELLRAVGRDEEALRWYSSFPEPSGYDITYLAPAYLRQGEINERLGHRAEAVEFYRRAAALWHDCEGPLRPLLTQAQRAIERLSAGS
jgi:DNA-binding SARP family transcriptional activator/Flp pilus assembly protein TadD